MQTNLLQLLLSFAMLIPLLILVFAALILWRKIPAVSTTLFFLGAVLAFLLMLLHVVIMAPPFHLIERIGIEIQAFFRIMQLGHLLAYSCLAFGLLLFAINLPARRQPPTRA